MKRIVCASIALLLILTGCITPAPIPDSLPERETTYGIYEFTFLVEQTSGVPTDEWNFVYTYNGETITSGHQILFSLELFTFHSIQVEVNQKNHPNNAYTATFPVAICDSGSGKVEIAVESSDGKTATFQIACRLTQVGSKNTA